MCPVESGNLNLPVAAASATEKFRLKLPRAALLLLIILPDSGVDLGFASSCKMYMEQVAQHIPVWCCSWFSPQKSEDTFSPVVPVGFAFVFYFILFPTGIFRSNNLALSVPLTVPQSWVPSGHFDFLKL